AGDRRYVRVRVRVAPAVRPQRPPARGARAGRHPGAGVGLHRRGAATRELHLRTTRPRRGGGTGPGRGSRRADHARDDRARRAGRGGPRRRVLAGRAGRLLGRRHAEQRVVPDQVRAVTGARQWANRRTGSPSTPPPTTTTTGPGSRSSSRSAATSEWGAT